LMVSLVSFINPLFRVVTILFNIVTDMNKKKAGNGNVPLLSLYTTAWQRQANSENGSVTGTSQYVSRYSPL